MQLVGNQRVYCFIFSPHHTSFLHSIKLSWIQNGNKIYRILQLQNKTIMRPKIVNACIVYDLDVQLKLPLNNFKLKNCFFGATNIIRIVIKLSECIPAVEQHLMEKVRRALVMTMLGMLYFFVLIIVHQLIKTISEIVFR